MYLSVAFVIQEFGVDAIEHDTGLFFSCILLF